MWSLAVVPAQPAEKRTAAVERARVRGHVGPLAQHRLYEQAVPLVRGRRAGCAGGGRRASRTPRRGRGSGRRCRCRPEGARVAIFYTKLHARLLRPLLVADQPQGTRGAPSRPGHDRPLHRRLRHQSAAWSRGMKLVTLSHVSTPRSPRPGARQPVDHMLTILIDEQVRIACMDSRTRPHAASACCERRRTLRNLDLHEPTVQWLSWSETMHESGWGCIRGGQGPRRSKPPVVSVSPHCLIASNFVFPRSIRRVLAPLRCLRQSRCRRTLNQPCTTS